MQRPGATPFTQQSADASPMWQSEIMPFTQRLGATPLTRPETPPPTHQPGTSQPARKPEPVLPGCKRKPRDHTAHSDAESPVPPSQARPHKKGRLLYEPESPADLGEDDEDQVTGEDEEGGKRRKWSEDETKKFVHALMGPDGSWDQYIKNPTRTLKKVSGPVDKNITSV